MPLPSSLKSLLHLPCTVYLTIFTLAQGQASLLHLSLLCCAPSSMHVGSPIIVLLVPSWHVLLNLLCLWHFYLPLFIPCIQSYRAAAFRATGNFSHRVDTELDIHRQKSTHVLRTRLCYQCHKKDNIGYCSVPHSTSVNLVLLEEHGILLVHLKIRMD